MSVRNDVVMLEFPCLLPYQYHILGNNLLHLLIFSLSYLEAGSL